MPIPRERRLALLLTMGVPCVLGTVVGLAQRSVIWGGSTAFAVVIVELLIVAPTVAFIEARRGR